MCQRCGHPCALPEAKAPFGTRESRCALRVQACAYAVAKRTSPTSKFAMPLTSITDGPFDTPSQDFPAGPSPLTEIVITGDLASRPSRERDLVGEIEALRELTRALGRSPRDALDVLCRQAMALCRAESAGVSIEEPDVFRWHATAGGLSSFQGGTMPRNFCPCGVVVESRSVQLMERMIRHYAYVDRLGLHLQEVLLVPFFHADKAVGTLWVVAHSPGKQFDSEDSRLLHVLAAAAAGIVESYKKVGELEAANAKLLAEEQRLQRVVALGETSVRELIRERDLRETFVAMLTHDLRNPLNTAVLSFELLRETQPLDCAQGYAARGIKALRRIDEMIGRMLDAARTRAGGESVLRLERCELRPLLQAAIDGLDGVQAPRVRLQLPETDIIGMWDAAGIHRVIENLVSNAAKYGAAAGTVTISANEADDWVSIAVHNEGKPIADADLPTLFEPYRRAEASQESDPRGWGLGLAVVKGVIEGHGGRVAVESSATAGTTFSVWLPVRGHAAATPAARET